MRDFNGSSHPRNTHSFAVVSLRSSTGYYPLTQPYNSKPLLSINNTIHELYPRRSECHRSESECVCLLIRFCTRPSYYSLRYCSKVQANWKEKKGNRNADFLAQSYCIWEYVNQIFNMKKGSLRLKVRLGCLYCIVQSICWTDVNPDRPEASEELVQL